MIIKYRVKHHNCLVGYIILDKNKELFLKKDQMILYNFENAILLNNGEYRAKSGYSIKTLDINDAIIIQNRNTNSIGKPQLLNISKYAKVSGTQKRILEKLNESQLCKFNKNKDNISIDMKDLSALTAYTGLEYSLFSRGGDYIVYKGTKYGMYINEKITNELILKKYKWIGHTHPGNTFNCMIPSDSDYETLNKFNQKQSVIYNSKGDYYIFGEKEV